jgi:hypothetical protein
MWNVKVALLFINGSIKRVVTVQIRARDRGSALHQTMIDIGRDPDCRFAVLFIERSE